MSVLLLDTTVIIDVLNEKRNRRQLLRELVASGHRLACCPINVTEVYAGLRPKEQSRTDAFLSSLEYYPITFPAARLAGELKQEYSRKGRTLSVSDSLIAAVTLYNGFTLLTDNTKDFPMKELSLYPLAAGFRS
jgi:predicted nucleic acid-binding protein